MKSYIIAFFLLISFNSFCQRDYKATFYVDSVKVDGSVKKIENTESKIDANGKIRVVLLENQESKISILMKVKTRKLKPKRIKAKSRVEIYRDGKWRKPKLKIKKVDGGGIKISRWETSAKFFLDRFTKSSKVMIPIDENITTEKGKTVNLQGTFEVEYK